MYKKILSLVFIGIVFSGLSVFAACKDTLTTGDAMKYDKKEIVIDKKCKNFTIELTHNGKMPKTAMGHNVVITQMKDITAVGAGGAAAGAKNHYVPKSKKVVASSKLIGGGEKTSVTFKVSDVSKGDYGFVCTFPGHWAVMKGKLTVK